MIKPYLPRRRTDVCTFGKCNTFLRQLFTRDRTAKIFPFLVHGSLSSTQTAVAAKHYFQGSILRVKGIDMLLFVWFGFVWFCLGWVGWLGGWVGGWGGWVVGWSVVGCWVVGWLGWLGGWVVGCGCCCCGGGGGCCLLLLVVCLFLRSDAKHSPGIRCLRL